MTNTEIEKAVVNLLIDYMISEGADKNACELLRGLMMKDYEPENKIKKALTREIYQTTENEPAAEPKPPRENTAGKPSKIDKGKVGALHDAGWPVGKIADEIGCSWSTIHRILKEHQEEDHDDQ